MAQQGFNLNDLLRGLGVTGEPPKNDGEMPTWSFSPQQTSEATKKMLRRLLIIFLIILIPAILVCYWWFHPAINVQSVDAWTFVGIFVLLPLFLWFYSRSKKYATSTKAGVASEKKAKTFKWLSFIPIAVVVVGLIGGLLSAVFFPGNAEKYANVLVSENSDFSQDIKEVNYSEIPIIDRDSAALLGNRVMGAIPEYVSQFEISPLYSQINYQGHPVRVSPLIYADLIKWFNNQATGLPGYVMVDMTTQETQIVKPEQPIMYSQSEPLTRNVNRHVQLSYPFYMFDEFSFEIDEEGRPWWVCPVQKRTIGLFGGTTIQRVVLCNASTGETMDLAVEDCPTWVDRAYPAELLIQQYNWSGAYKNGWINSWLGQTGVVQTTPGTDGLLGYNYIAKDDDVWVYSGVTSAVSDEGIVGFILVNQRTAESHYYAIAGATESSAMLSAQGQVQHLSYRATFPLLLNINSQPTYFMALKDAAGLVKMYAMLDIQRYQNVAVGSTLQECQTSYLDLLRTNGVEVPEEATPDYTQTTGTVERIATAVIGGNSHFYLKLTGSSDIYDCPLPAMMDVLLVGVGDEVKLGFSEVDGAKVVGQLSVTKSAGGATVADGAASVGGASAAAGSGTTGTGNSTSGSAT
ncbi:MAG TPA: Tat pathway signal sequence [Coriobacteriia bacterium]|nr:Tat pathway signal sequence [Coriobacteriia bacterium]